MYLPHTWGGEANLKGYYKTLKELDKNLQEVKQKYHISGIIAGMDAQVEVQPRQGSYVGSGTRMSRGSTARYHEMESKFENMPMEWTTKHEIKLANTFCKQMGTYEGQDKQNWIFGSRVNNNCRSGRSLTTLRCPSSGKQEALWQEIAGLRTLQIIGQ